MMTTTEIGENIATANNTLQEKLNGMLATVIAEFEALGYEHYPIEPQVRLTNNKTRLGSAQAINGAALIVPRKGRKKRTPYWKDGLEPVFRISISRRECGDDASIRNVLFHEVIHTCEGCFNHGKKFKELAAAVNSAYGTNVETSKKAERPDTGMTKSELLSLLESHVGETFASKRKKLTLTGFNNKPKYCCDLVDARGARYTAPPQTVAIGLGLIDGE